MDLLQKIENLEQELKNKHRLLENSLNENMYNKYILNNKDSNKLPELFKIGNLTNEQGVSVPALVPLKKINGFGYLSSGP